MGIKIVPHRLYSPDLAPFDFWLFPKLRGCRYETIEEMKEAVTKIIDTLTKEDFHGVFQKLLERYNKYIAAGGDYFEGDYSFMCVLSIKVPIRKKPGNLSNDPRIFAVRIFHIIHKHTMASLTNKTWKSEFESHWVPHLFGLVPHLSKTLSKLLLDQVSFPFPHQSGYLCFF